MKDGCQVDLANEGSQCGYHKEIKVKGKRIREWEASIEYSISGSGQWLLAAHYVRGNTTCMHYDLAAATDAGRRMARSLLVCELWRQRKSYFIKTSWSG